MWVRVFPEDSVRDKTHLKADGITYMLEARGNKMGSGGNGIAFSLLPGCHPEIEPSETGSQKEQLALKLSCDSSQEVTNTAPTLEVLLRV